MKISLKIIEFFLAFVALLLLVTGNIGGGIFFIVFDLLIILISIRNLKKIEKMQKEEAERQARIQEALNNAIVNSIVIDTETTGFRANGNDELLQISIVDINGSTLFNHLIKPSHRKSWPKAAEINGITPKMVKNEAPVTSYLDELNEIFSKATCVIGYNTSFDMSFLFAAGIKYKGPTLDIMKDFADYRGVYDSYHKHNKWFKLTECAEYFKYDWGKDKAHDSLSDAKATLYCYQELKETGFYKGKNRLRTAF